MGQQNTNAERIDRPTNVDISNFPQNNVNFFLEKKSSSNMEHVKMQSQKLKFTIYGIFSKFKLKFSRKQEMKESLSANVNIISSDPIPKKVQNTGKENKKLNPKHFFTSLRSRFSIRKKSSRSKTAQKYNVQHPEAQFLKHRSISEPKLYSASMASERKKYIKSFSWPNIYSIDRNCKQNFNKEYFVNLLKFISRKPEIETVRETGDNFIPKAKDSSSIEELNVNGTILQLPCDKFQPSEKRVTLNFESYFRERKYGGNEFHSNPKNRLFLCRKLQLTPKFCYSENDLNKEHSRFELCEQRFLSLDPEVLRRVNSLEKLFSTNMPARNSKIDFITDELFSLSGEYPEINERDYLNYYVEQQTPDSGFDPRTSFEHFLKNDAFSSSPSSMYPLVTNYLSSDFSKDIYKGLLAPPPSPYSLTTISPFSGLSLQSYLNFYASPHTQSPYPDDSSGCIIPQNYMDFVDTSPYPMTATYPSSNISPQSFVNNEPEFQSHYAETNYQNGSNVPSSFERNTYSKYGVPRSLQNSWYIDSSSNILRNTSPSNRVSGNIHESADTNPQSYLKEHKRSSRRNSNVKISNRNTNLASQYSNQVFYQGNSENIKVSKHDTVSGTSLTENMLRNTSVKPKRRPTNNYPMTAVKSKHERGCRKSFAGKSSESSRNNLPLNPRGQFHTSANDPHNCYSFSGTDLNEYMLRTHGYNCPPPSKSYTAEWVRSQCSGFSYASDNPRSLITSNVPWVNIRPELYSLIPTHSWHSQENEIQTFVDSSGMVYKYYPYIDGPNPASDFISYDPYNNIYHQEEINPINGNFMQSSKYCTNKQCPRYAGQRNMHSGMNSEKYARKGHQTKTEVTEHLKPGNHLNYCKSVRKKKRNATLEKPLTHLVANPTDSENPQFSSLQSYVDTLHGFQGRDNGDAKLNRQHASKFENVGKTVNATNKKRKVADIIRFNSNTLFSSMMPNRKQ